VKRGERCWFPKNGRQHWFPNSGRQRWFSKQNQFPISFKNNNNKIKRNGVRGKANVKILFLRIIVAVKNDIF